MTLPNNGKIIIIDDIEADVKPLMQALKKEKMPFLYFKEADDLPLQDEGPIANIRLVFLDLDLGLGDSSNRKQKIRVVQERLFALVEPNTPYVLVIWSTHEDPLLPLLMEDFDGQFKEYSPIVQCSFDKQDTLHGGQGEPMQIIRKKLKSELGKFESFNVFLFWESIVCNSVGHIVNQFTNFVPKEKDWNNEVRYILYRLAKAYAGKQVDEATYEDVEILKSALATLNQNLVDTIEIVTGERIKEFEITPDLFLNPNGNNDFIPNVNTRLLIGDAGNSGLVPGNVFFPLKEIDKRRQDMESKLVKMRASDKIPIDKREGAIKRQEQKNQELSINFEKEENQIYQSYKRILSDGLKQEGREIREQIFQRCEFLELNISPLCDYAQNKLPCCRLLPGMLIKSEDFGFLNKDAAYSYISDVPVNYKSSQYYLMFDFRYLHSRNSNCVKSRKAEFKLKHLLLADIQLKLGNHVNRAGVIYA